MMALRGEERVAFGAASTAVIAAAWTLLSLEPPATWTLAGTVAVIYSALGLAWVWRRTGAPNLCFQLAVLGIALALTLVYVFVSDPQALWVERLTHLVRVMSEAGITLEGDVDLLIRMWARTMWGALAALTLGAILLSLFLGRWWAALLQTSDEFGKEFRQLRLGRVLGVAVTVLLIAALGLQFAWIDSLAWVALAGLAFQGLAAAHRSKATGHLHRGWIAAIYVLLLIPLSTSVAVLMLATWGFVDNWLRPPRVSG